MKFSREKLTKRAVEKFHLQMDQSWVIMGQLIKRWSIDSSALSQRGQEVAEIERKQLSLDLVGRISKYNISKYLTIINKLFFLFLTIINKLKEWA